jgi:hypothetical protein
LFDVPEVPSKKISRTGIIIDEDTREVEMKCVTETKIRI